MKKNLLLVWLGCLLTSVSVAQSLPVHPDLFRKQWPAAWITQPGAPGRAYGVYHFRRTFSLPARPDSFLVHVTADNRYRLFVNGKPVGFGPARGDKMHWRFETYNLAPYLQAGKNVVAAQVWNMGDDVPIAQQTWQTGFLVQGNTEREAVLNTNAQDWKVTQNGAYQPLHVAGEVSGYYAAGACDSVSAARYPWGWEKPDFDDRGWQSAQAVRAGKPAYYRYGYGEGDGNLVPRNIPMMEEKPERIPRLVRATGLKTDGNFLKGNAPLVIPANTQATLLLDQTYLTTAYPELIVSGGAGSYIRVGYAETLLDAKGEKGNRNETEGKVLRGYHDSFLPDGGEERLFRPLWFRTYRYIQLDIRTAAQPLTIRDYYGHFTAYPFEQQGSFRSNDPTLQSIWEIGWRTARLCAHETYFDCPYYEQLQYVGDTRIQALISLHVSGDDRLMRNALQLYDHSRLPEGITQSRYPTDYAQMIPPFSLYWVAMVHDYHTYRSDTAFVKQFLPGIRTVLSWYEAHLNAQHLLSNMGWWNFVDWVPQYQRGVPGGAEDGRGTSIISLQYVYALDRAAQLFAYFGQTEEAAQYRRQAELIRRAVYEQCYDKGRDLFADTPEKREFSQHASVMAILTDVVPAAEQPALMQRLLQDQTLLQCTIYYKFYLMQALKKAGMGDQYLEQLGSWKGMLAQGLTTFAETELQARSDCHAWSSSPLIELLATVCGIEPAEAGFRSVRIEPHLGQLKEATGRMPHPRGNIEVKLKRRGSQGITADITLPDGLSGNFVWKGEKIALKPGRQTVVK